MKQKALVAEFIGAFTLLFVGVGSIAANAGNVGIALAHGLAIGVMVGAFGAISGGHFNPAVSFGVFVAKKISGATLVSYWIVQVLGAITGVFVLRQCISADVLAQVGMGAPGLGDGVTKVGGILMEAVLTFMLVSVVLGAAVDKRANTAAAGLYIGLTITMAALVAGGVTGAAVNPARFLGSAVFYQDAMQNLVVYLVGPLLGGAVAGALYGGFLEDKSAG